MAAKKKEEGQMGAENAAPLAFDISKTSVDFNMEATLKAFKDKMGENAQRKWSISERITNAKKNITRIQNMIANLEIKKNSESGSAFMALVVRQVAEQLSLGLGNIKVDIFGPLGLSGQSTVSLQKRGENGKVETRSVTLLPTPEGGIAIRDYSQSSDEYAPGSPEYLSGWNHPTVPVPTESALEFIADWLLKS